MTLQPKPKNVFIYFLIIVLFSNPDINKTKLMFHITLSMPVLDNQT